MIIIEGNIFLINKQTKEYQTDTLSFGLEIIHFKISLIKRTNYNNCQETIGFIAQHELVIKIMYYSRSIRILDRCDEIFISKKKKKEEIERPITKQLLPVTY